MTSGGALSQLLMRDMRCNGAGCVRDPLGHEVDSQNGELASEFLRVADIDEYVEEHPDLVATAVEMRRGRGGCSSTSTRRSRAAQPPRQPHALVARLSVPGRARQHAAGRARMLDDAAPCGTARRSSTASTRGQAPSRACGCRRARALAKNFALGGHHWGEVIHTHKDELRVGGGARAKAVRSAYRAARRALRYRQT